MYKAFFMPKVLLECGPTRFMPFMHRTGPSVLGPIDLGPDCKPIEPSKASFGFLGNLINTILSPIVNILLPGVKPAVTAVAGTVAAGANLATGVVQAATGPITGAITVAKTAVVEVPKAIGSLPGAATAAVGQVGEQTRAQIAAAKGLQKIQTGGALLAFEKTQDYLAFPALTFVLVAILGVGGVLGFLEVKRQYDLSRNTDADAVKPLHSKSARDDTPPRPYVL